MYDFIDEVKLDKEKKDIFKGKIKFAGKDFLIYDYFIYNNEKYFYIIEDKEEFKEEKDLTKFFENDLSSIRIEFIYEVDKEKHIYETVIDEQLLSILNAEEANRILKGLI